MADTGMKKYTADEIKGMDPETTVNLVLSLQDQVTSLSESFEKLIEQLRIANQDRFGRHSEKLDVIDGQVGVGLHPQGHDARHHRRRHGCAS